jgi:hypothetical protein
MEIRLADIADKANIIALYERSQAASGIPDPAYTLPEELGTQLYGRNALARFVVMQTGVIIGHTMIEHANQIHCPQWQTAIGPSNKTLLEIGGAFVEPTSTRQGVFGSLLSRCLKVIREDHQAVPVSATWSANEHVMRTFARQGGVDIGTKATERGEIHLFIF